MSAHVLLTLLNEVVQKIRCEALKGTITNWSDIVILLKLCILQEECLSGWKMK